MRAFLNHRNWCSRAVDPGPGTSLPRQFVGVATTSGIRSYMDWKVYPGPWQRRELRMVDFATRVPCCTPQDRPG